MGMEIIENTASYPDSDHKIASVFFREHYDELLALARNRRRRHKISDTLQTQDILHETFLKVSGNTYWQSPDHFIRTAALAIRQVIIDHARKMQSAKRGGDCQKISFDAVQDFLPEYGETPEQIIMIADLLEKMGNINPRWVNVVDARYFSGLTEQETAKICNLSVRTVRRDWKAARQWLATRILPENAA